MVEPVKLSAPQAKAVEEIRARLRSVDDAGHDVIDWVVGQMRSLLRVEMAGAYALEDSITGPRLAFGAWSGLPIEASRVNWHLSAGLERIGQFGAYDALRPSRRQRNRLLALPSTREIEEMTEINVRALRVEERQQVISRIRQHHETFVNIGVHELKHQRVRICDGSRLLAWFGVLASDHCPLQRRRLVELLASLVRPRLRLERERKNSGVTYAALDAALEVIGAPALILSADGTVVHVNAVAQQLLDSGRHRIADLLARVKRGGAGDVDIYDLGAHGHPGGRLVVLRSRGMLAATRHRTAAVTWKLTPREAEVLQLLIVGDTNRDIATTLGCAEATVEIHVSRLLKKAGVPTRTALVSAYWTLGTPI